MTTDPWRVTATPPITCVVCGEGVGRHPVIVAAPHTYHRGCYTAFHRALWAKENAGKTIVAVRAVVAAAKGGKA